METPKRQLLTLRVRPVDKPMIERLTRASEVTDLSAAHLMRQAIKEKLDRLAAQFPEIDAIPQQQPAVTN